MKRLPNEGARAYEAFCLYAHLGPDRSLNETARQLSKSKAIINRWAGDYHWKERVFALDEHLMSLALRAEEKRVTREAGQWAERIVATREQMYAISEDLIAKATAMLKFPLTETVSKDGKTIIKPGRWSLADAPRLLELACKLRLLATGQPTERFEHTGVVTAATDPQAPPLRDLELIVLDQMRRELQHEAKDPQPARLPDATLPHPGSHSPSAASRPDDLRPGL